MMEGEIMNSYSLSRSWFNWCFENPHKITPTHTALYFFAIEHCNRLGWKKVFGFPTTMVMEALGIKSYNTYKKILIDLVDFGFINMIEKSKNQYSANIIALSKFDKAPDEASNKALDKALAKHATKQSESIDSIIKQINNKQITIEQVTKDQKDFLLSFLIGTDEKDTTHFDFLKQNHASIAEQIEMELFRKKIPQEKIIPFFNNACVMEDIPFQSTKIRARFNNLILNWKEEVKQTNSPF